MASATVPADFQLVEDVLRYAHTALCAEALALGIEAELDVGIMYEAISGALGSCWSWVNHVPLMLGLNADEPGGGSLGDALDTLATFAARAKAEKVATPLIALIRQQYNVAARRGGRYVGAECVVVSYPVDLAAAAQPVWRRTARPRAVNVAAGRSVGRLAFLGLGSMGLGMASVLQKSGFDVVGCDVYKPSLDKFAAMGGKTAASAEEACQGADVLVLMVVSAVQAEETLFDKGAVKVLAKDASILLMSTVSRSDALRIKQRLKETRPDLALIDCPVSGGVARAAQGDLTILCSGDEAGLAHSLPVLQAMSGTLGKESNLCVIPGGVGGGSAVKMAHQALAGTQITLVAEVMAFAARIGLPLRELREHLLRDGSTATSGIIRTRGQNMLDGLLQPNSTVDIWLKDLGIVVDEAAAMKVPVYFSAYVLQFNILASSYGWGLQDDSSTTRMWQPAGIVVAQSQ